MAVTPDANVTFWYGCNMTRHGEIVRLVTHILEAVGVAAAPAGGPGYCCGSTQEANARIAAGMAARTVEKFNQAGRDTVVTWCPSCHMNMDDLMAPVTETAFETQHITQLLAARAERLRPLLTHPRPGAGSAACASRLPRPCAGQHGRADAAPHDPRADGPRPSAAHPRAYVFRDRTQAWRDWRRRTAIRWRPCRISARTLW